MVFYLERMSKFIIMGLILKKRATAVFKKLMDKLLDILGLEIVEQTQTPINQDSLLDSDDLKQHLKEEEVDGCLMWVGCSTETRQSSILHKN